MPDFFPKVYSYTVIFNQHKSDMHPIFGLLMLWAHGTCFSESRLSIYTSHASWLYPL